MYSDQKVLTITILQKFTKKLQLNKTNTHYYKDNIVKYTQNIIDISDGEQIYFLFFGFRAEDHIFSGTHRLVAERSWHHPAQVNNHFI